MPDTEHIDLKHDVAEQQFHIVINDQKAFIDYRVLPDGRLDLHHTRVPDALAGKGVGSALVNKTLSLIQSEGKAIKASCSFIASYIKRHPEYESLLAVPKKAPLTLYAYSFRSRAERVIWTLEALAMDYNLIRLDPRKGEHLSAEFTALNPTRKIPVLVHQGKVLTESLAIMEYLNQLDGNNRLIPQNIDENYTFRQLMYFMLSEIEAYLWIANQASVLKEIYYWPEGTLQEAMQRVEKSIPTLFTQLSGKQYAVGTHLSLADIYAYQIVTWAQAFDVVIPDAVDEYLKGLESREDFPDVMRGKDR